MKVAGVIIALPGLAFLGMLGVGKLFDGLGVVGTFVVLALGGLALIGLGADD